MSLISWSSLLPKHEAIKEMSVDELRKTADSTKEYACTLAHGISGIGNLLACTASNGQTGLSDQAVTSVGWMLESMGTLISNLVDTQAAAEYHLQVKLPRA